eukprot:gene5251-7297_t
MSGDVHFFDHLGENSVTLIDLFDKDRHYKHCLFYIAYAPSMNMIMLLMNQLNSLTQSFNERRKHISTAEGLLGYVDDEDDEEICEEKDAQDGNISVKDKDTEKNPMRYSDLQRQSTASQSRKNNKWGNILKEGWLKKKRGGSILDKKRWAILTEDHLLYFKNPQSLDRPRFMLPVVGCSIQRLPISKDPIIELVSPFMSEKKTMFGSSKKKLILLTAENEQELQEWLMPLRAVAGNVSLRTHREENKVASTKMTSHEPSSPRSSFIRTESFAQAKFLENPLKLPNKKLPSESPNANGNTYPISDIIQPVYINLDIRRIWCNRLDDALNTPLHILMHRIPYKNTSETAHVSAWLIENGCPVNQINSFQQTALHVALTERVHLDLVYCLIAKGADINNIKNQDGLTARDLIELNKQSFISAGEPLPSFAKSNLSISSLQRTNSKISVGKGAGPKTLTRQFSSQSSVSSISTVSETDHDKFRHLFQLISNRDRDEHAKKDNLNKIYPTISHIQKIKGYSYLKIYFKSHIFDVRPAIKEPVLIISVFNQKLQQVEKVQQVGYPIHWSVASAAVQSLASQSSRRSHIVENYWGCQYTMVTPLENIETGSFILFELKEYGDTSIVDPQQNKSNSLLRNNPSVISNEWAYYVIDRDTINSANDTSVIFMKYPVTIFDQTSNSTSKKKQKLIGLPPPPKETVSKGGDGCSKLQCDIILHRKEYPLGVDVIMIMK